MATCPNCNGTGELEGPSWAPPISWSIKACPTCDGTGKVSTSVARWDIICPRCKGWGNESPLITSFTCQDCQGRGMVSRGRRRAIND